MLSPGRHTPGYEEKTAIGETPIAVAAVLSNVII
jgi:hypothetical protein